MYSRGRTIRSVNAELGWEEDFHAGGYGGVNKRLLEGQGISGDDARNRAYDCILTFKCIA